MDVVYVVVVWKGHYTRKTGEMLSKFQKKNIYIYKHLRLFPMTRVYKYIQKFIVPCYDMGCYISGIRAWFTIAWDFVWEKYEYMVD